MNINTSWVEVDTSALKHNFSEVRKLIPESVAVMAVVKADAYGHGLVGGARAFAEAGADCLGVTTLEEGLTLRESGVEIPVLIFSPLLPDQVAPAVEKRLDMTVCGAEIVTCVSEAAERIGVPARVHAKVDTGMGRLGVSPQDCPALMYRLHNSAGVEVAGVYTHFANAGSKDLAHAWHQNTLFLEVLKNLREREIPYGIAHAANSAALLNIADSYHDMVRPGTILYGQNPSSRLFRRLPLRDTWALKTRIIALKHLGVGEKVGYGSEFTAVRPTVAAVIPVGYADGFSMIPDSIARRAADPLRLAANRILGVKPQLSVTVKGGKAPVLGRISMQMCSIDVTEISGVQVGDEVTVPARRTATSSRLPRIYLGES